jgi:hypothetical protein
VTQSSIAAVPFIEAGIPPLILILLLVVVIIPFILPPVRSWRLASPQEKVSVVMYGIAVLFLVLYFVLFFG